MAFYRIELVMDLSWVDTDSDTKPWALNFAVDIQFLMKLPFKLKNDHFSLLNDFIDLYCGGQ